MRRPDREIEVNCYRLVAEVRVNRNRCETAPRVNIDTTGSMFSVSKRFRNYHVQQGNEGLAKACTNRECTGEPQRGFATHATTNATTIETSEQIPARPKGRRKGKSKSKGNTERK